MASPVAWLLAGSTVWINDRVLPKTPGMIEALQYLLVILAGGVAPGVLSAAALRASCLRGSTS